jgi:hypothetical protein
MLPVAYLIPSVSAARQAADVAAAIIGVADVLIKAGFVLGGVLLLVRWRARAHRRYVRLWLLPYRSDEAEPEAIQRMFEAWHQQLLERWWRRVTRGQRSIALEVAIGRDAEGDMSAALSIVCPEELVPAIEGSLVSCYPDARVLTSGGSLPPVARVVSLKKRYGFERALRAAERRTRLIDAALSQMTSLEQPAVLQFTILPTPALFDLYGRRRFRRHERRTWSERRQRAPRSELIGQELEGGLRVQNRPLFFSEIRVAAQSYGAAAALAGTVRGESAGENRLVERYQRPWATGRLYVAWLQRGLACPVPDWRRGVLSSEELGVLWHLPSPGLKTVRILRTAVPRLPAPPDITRNPELALANDERGLVGILPEDKSDGLGLIGGQKTGKTSLLIRTVQADALDPECAMVVLMPKPGDARKALAMIPPGRTVHYLDLEHPEFGINPLLATGDPAMVADKIVDAFRDVNAEGDIRGSSDRYLRQSAQAAIGASRSGLLEGPPTLWHMYRMLLPGESLFRERVTGALLSDPRFADTATFFGRELPNDLREATSQTTAKLDAPRNKLLRLMVESLDKVLRHPIQLDLDELVRRREVLIIDGKMGTFGADNCRVMMQFVLNTLYGTLQRQQQLREEERVRVALKVDEAHLVVNESFADAMATLRSAGLEVVAAWQYGEQIQDPKIRSGMMSLLRQRCMFSMGEAADAREMSTIAMAVYSDMIRTDPEERARMRLTPDTIFNLPNHYALCSWISRGVRAPAFIAQTMPLSVDESVAELHLAAQRQRGYHVPAQLPDPLPDLDWTGVREIPSALVEGAAPAPAGLLPAAPELPVHNGHGNGTGESYRNGGGPHAGIVPDERVLVLAPRADVRSARGEEAAERVADSPSELVTDPAGGAGASTGSGSGAPPTFTELDLDEVRGILWEKVDAMAPDQRPEPTPRELEILGALWSYRFLFATQVWRRWWGESSQRAAQQGMNRMARAGWVRRFKFQLPERGAQQRVYCLTKDGFELARGRLGRYGPCIEQDAHWREPQINDPRRILRDLHVNGWVLALERVGGRNLGRWRGPREGRIDPPRQKVRGEWVEIRPAAVVLGSNHMLRDYDGERFEAVSPDATVEVKVKVGGERMQFDLMIEMERGRGGGNVEDRLRRYDGLISGWHQMLARYRTLGVAPVVVFVTEDERANLRLLKLADRVVTGRIAKAGTDEASWPCPGRRGMFFAVERSIHEGSLEALQLPEQPPELRMRLEGARARTCTPRRVHIVEPGLLRGRN